MPIVDGHVPRAGDVYWVDFGAPPSHEQAGRRPALVLSSEAYNSRSSLTVVCPITRNPGPWPFKVEIPAVGRIQGFALVDQLRSIDLFARPRRFAGRLPKQAMAMVLERLELLFDLRNA